MRGKPVVFDELGRGGVNLLDAAYTLKDYEARDARNVVSTARGSIRKRDGSVQFATPGANPLGLFASLNPLSLIASSATALYAISTAGVVANIGSGLTNALWEFINAAASGGQGPLWGMNGTEARQWTGSGSVAAWTASTGTLPIGKYLLYANRRVWVAGMTAYGAVSDPGSTLVFSNVGDPRDWPAANVVQFDPNDGESITGLGIVGPYIVVYKQSKAWIVYDLDTGANRPLGEGVGCMSHRSIVPTPMGTFFISRDHGVMVTDGSTAKKMSDRVKPLLDLLSASQRAAVTAEHFNDHYYISFSTGGTQNDVTLDYDAKLDAWWIHSIGVQDFASWDRGGLGAVLYGARPGAAAVDTLFVPGVLSDHGVAFSCYWQGPFHVFGQPAIRKRVREIRADVTGRCQAYLATDFKAATQLADDTVVIGDGTIYGANDGSSFGVNDLPAQVYGNVPSDQLEILTPGVARAWSIQFGNQTSEAMEVDSYTFAVQARTD